MFEHSHCLIVISKTSIENQKEVFSIARLFQKLTIETKVMAVIAADSLVDEKQYFNISVHALLFQITAGMWITWWCDIKFLN